jgi:hypothetical protein
MSTQHNLQVQSTITRRLWTYPEAVKALPYVRVIVRSLREQWLHLQQVRLRLRRLDDRSGRRDRQALILRGEAAREAGRAESNFDDTRRELESLDISSLDPVKGLALIPLRQGDERVWFVFDLFAPQGREAWWFDEDSLETRRPLVEPLDPRMVDAVFSSRRFAVSMIAGQ